MTTTVLPLIHSNGNSAESLQKEYFEAYRKIVQFRETFYKIEFHMRDYYPLGEEMMKDAIASRKEMGVHIERVEDYLKEHLEHLADQINKK